MRPIDSAYDRTAANQTTRLLDALTAAGRNVETFTNGAVEVDGTLINPQDWDRYAMTWDGTDTGLEDLPF